MNTTIHRKELRIFHKDLALLAGTVLEAGKGFRFRAHGRSMAPWIRDGDMLEIYPLEPGQVRRGDVLLCQMTAGLLLAHRVIRVLKVEQNGKLQISVQLQGDAFLCSDGVVQASQILGRVERLHRKEGQFTCSSAAYRVAVWLWLLPGVRKLYQLFLRG